jgi:hypothetical protein
MFLCRAQAEPALATQQPQQQSCDQIPFWQSIDVDFGY